MSDGVALMKVRQGAGPLELRPHGGRPIGSHEALVEVVAAGLCGTDLHIEQGEWPCEPPVVLGHEVAGDVVEVGAGVEPSWLGARVACETFFSTDETCPACRSGHPNLCGQRRSIGSGVDGGFASHVVVPARCLRRIPDALSYCAATLMEPLACVCNCLLDPAVCQVGDRVLVMGPGPVGLLAAQLARAAGSSVLVVGTTTDGVRLKTARHLGFASAAFDDTATIERFAEPNGRYDVAIECAGSAKAIGLALSMLRPRGQLVQIGLAGAATEVPFDLIVSREITVRGGLAAPPHAWDRAQRVVAGHVELEPLVTHELPLQQWRRGFQLARRGEAVKVVFHPSPRSNQSQEREA
jgi:L-iditol 2-dehydrogenase